MRLSMYGGLLGIGSDSVNLQQSIGVKLCFWKCLQVGFWFHTFLWILQVLLCLFLQSLALFSCPLASLCMIECIRLTNMPWIFAHQCHGIWFDSPLLNLPKLSKLNLFAHGLLDMSLIPLMMMIQSWNSQKDIKQSIFRFYLI